MSQSATDPAPADTSRPSKAHGGRTGLLAVARESRENLGSSARRVPLLILLSFGLGLLEASLVYLVVQMAVGLAGGADVFDLVLGPLEFTDQPITWGVKIGAVLIAGLVLCLLPVAKISARLAATAQEQMRRSLLEAYLEANWDVRSRYPEGHLQELLTTYSMRAERSVTHLVAAAVAACGLCAILFVAFMASPAVASATILCVGLAGLLLRPVLHRTRAASAAYASADHGFATRMAEIARMTPEIAVFDVAKTVSHQVVVDASAVARALRRIRVLLRLGTGLYQYTALFLVVLALGAVSSFASTDELARMGGVLLLMVRALAYGQQLQGEIQSTHEIAPFLESIRTELDTLGAAKQDRSGVTIDRPAPVIFDDVSFAYEPGTPVLRGINLHIDKGEAVAFVGRSGTGKSTLVQLLLRLRTPTTGTITAAGTPLAGIALAEWYHHVAYVPQDNKLIRGTIRENIRFYRPEITDDAIVDAALRARLLEEIEELPDGFDTEIGPGSRDLSGGQRQRLGIARALAGSPSMMVLDEPTSALDSRSEALVAETLQALHGTVTMVIVAHRPATTRFCDRILRMVDGRLVDEGPPATDGHTDERPPAGAAPSVAPSPAPADR